MLKQHILFIRFDNKAKYVKNKTMTNRNEQIYELVYSLPISEELRKQYIDKTKKLTKECGCGMGAKFTALSLILITIDCVFFYNIQWNTVLVRILAYLSFILILTITGKLLGLMMARIKKYWLYKDLLKNKNHTLVWDV
jgi:hypothetical protein